MAPRVFELKMIDRPMIELRHNTEPLRLVFTPALIKLVLEYGLGVGIPIDTFATWRLGDCLRVRGLNLTDFQLEI